MTPARGVIVTIRESGSSALSITQLKIPNAYCVRSQCVCDPESQPKHIAPAIQFTTRQLFLGTSCNTKPDGIVGVQQLKEYENSVAVEFTWSGLLTAGTNVKRYFNIYKLFM